MLMRLLGFCLLGVVTSVVGSEIWKILRRSIAHRRPESWAIRRLKMEKLQLDKKVLPGTLRDEVDWKTLNTFMKHFVSEETGMMNVLEMLISEHYGSSYFHQVLVPRKQWISDWGSIMKLIREKAGCRFSEYFMIIMECIPYMEELASYYHPAFDHLTDEPMATYVRLSPFFYIIKEPNEYSDKLRREFSNVFMISETQPVDIYLPVLEDFLKVSRYLRRATSNEKAYFNINLWIRDTFLRHPKAINYIIKNDLYRLAYVAFLPGIKQSHLKRIATACSFKILAMLLGRNKPKDVLINVQTCQEIEGMLEIYNYYATEPVHVPCSHEDQPIKVKIPRTMLDTDQNYCITQMLLGRLGQVPLDFDTEEQWEIDGAKNPIRRLNSILQEYCDMYNLKPNIKVQPSRR